MIFQHILIYKFCDKGMFSCPENTFPIQQVCVTFSEVYYCTDKLDLDPVS